MESADKPPRLIDALRWQVRRWGLSRTERAYAGWTRRFIVVNGKRHPREVAARGVEEFLTSLATHSHVAPSTHNRAPSALLFLDREVLGREIPWMDEIRCAKRPVPMSAVLARDEVNALLEQPAVSSGS